MSTLLLESGVEQDRFVEKSTIRTNFFNGGSPEEQLCWYKLQMPLDCEPDGNVVPIGLSYVTFAFYFFLGGLLVAFIVFKLFYPLLEKRQKCKESIRIITVHKKAVVTLT